LHPCAAQVEETSQVKVEATQQEQSSGSASTNDGKISKVSMDSSSGADAFVLDSLVDSLGAVLIQQQQTDLMIKGR
jgi:hypothetical protein